MSQSKCVKCKRFLGKSGVCTFCKDNNFLSDFGSNLSDPEFVPALDVMDSSPPPARPSINQESCTGSGAVLLSELREMIVALSIKIGFLSSRFDGFERCLDGLHLNIGSLDTRMRSLEDVLAASVNNFSGAIDGVSADHRSLDTRLSAVEARCEFLERSPLSGGSLVQPDIAAVERRLNSFEGEQEIIIFGLPALQRKKKMLILATLAAKFGITIVERLSDLCSPDVPFGGKIHINSP